MDPEVLEQAREEMRLLQDVISRRESHAVSQLNWLYTIVVGLSLLVLQAEAKLSPFNYIVLCLVVVLLFYLSDVIQRVPIDRAISRSRKIEGAINKKGDYDGVRLNASLSESRPFWGDLKFAFKLRICAPYVFCLIACMVVFCVALPVPTGAGDH